MTKFVAHKKGITPIQCQDLNLNAYAGEYLIVDVTAYDFETFGDLVLFAYRGQRNGVFDGGPEHPAPQVTVVGARADLVYDDKARQVKLTNFRL